MTLFLGYEFIANCSWSFLVRSRDLGSQDQENLSYSKYSDICILLLKSSLVVLMEIQNPTGPTVLTGIPYHYPSCCVHKGVESTWNYYLQKLLLKQKFCPSFSLSLSSLDPPSNLRGGQACQSQPLCHACFWDWIMIILKIWLLFGPKWCCT